MPTSPTAPARLRSIEDSPVVGLSVSERRVLEPRASIICVHGALDRGGSFSRLARRLDDFDVVAYDRRGYQGSRALGPASLDRHIEDLSALVEREAATSPVILFGHSFGGIVTMGAAINEPSLVKLVVNYESPVPWVLRRHNAPVALSDDASLEAEQFFRRIMSDRLWERLSERERESRRLDGPALVSDLATVRHDGAPYDLRTIRVPTTYVHGDGASASYYRSLGAALRMINANFTVIEISHAAHAAHLQNARQLAHVIVEQWDAACASA